MSHNQRNGNRGSLRSSLLSSAPSSASSIASSNTSLGCRLFSKQPQNKAITSRKACQILIVSIAALLLLVQLHTFYQINKLCPNCHEQGSPLCSLSSTRSRGVRTLRKPPIAKGATNIGIPPNYAKQHPHILSPGGGGKPSDAYQQHRGTNDLYQQQSQSYKVAQSTTQKKAPKKKYPPVPKSPPPPKNHLLPKHVITIFGPESSGTTFLSTALGVATGAFAKEGQWRWVPISGSSTPKDKDGAVHDQLGNQKPHWAFEENVGRRIMSHDGLWEIQHISLPWGWFCEENVTVDVVEALVPEECFRYEVDPHLDAKMAEHMWYSKNRKKKGRVGVPGADRMGRYHSTIGGGGEGNHNAGKVEWSESVRRRLTLFDPAAERAKIRLEREMKLQAMCRDEVHISEANDNNDDSEWTCGARCGTGPYSGYALYPKRFSVNITSHIEWYLSRGVDVTAILSVRDRTVSKKGKLQDHCRLDAEGKAEDDVALGLMAEALERYGKRGTSLSGNGGGKERAIAISYEGLMGMQGAYLFDLYHQLGINSTYVPTFSDGNAKYVTIPKQSKPHTKEQKEAQKKLEMDSRPPKPVSYQPPPPKENLLPKKIIAVFGTESSGTTFLSTALGVATGAFPDGGQWVQVLAPGRASALDGEPLPPRKKWVFQKSIPRRAFSSDGEWEVQHLSLPWGWQCESETGMGGINIVEALVPEECFRYINFPSFDQRLAEQIWYNKHRKRAPGGAAVGGWRIGRTRPRFSEEIDDNIDWVADFSGRSQTEAEFAEKCRDQVHISAANGGSLPQWTCGALCGHDDFDGYALYPNRFSVNITSHIEWYLSRGVDIKVVITMRDRSISQRGKRRDHCTDTALGDKEDESALSLMREALSRYGKSGSRKRGRDERAIAVSYESLMEFKEVYLFDLYHQLGINSTYVPKFEDGNTKYISNATKEELQPSVKKRPSQYNHNSMQQRKEIRRPPKDWKAPPPKEHLLPKRVITIFGPESSGTTFLSTALGVATGAFNASGQWQEILGMPIEKNSQGRASRTTNSRTPVKKMDFKTTVGKRESSPDGTWEIQHLSLPWGWMCEESSEDNSHLRIVDALVPDECFRYERDASLDAHFAESLFWNQHRREMMDKQKKEHRNHRRLTGSVTQDDPVMREKCRSQVHISENSGDCGGKCGEGPYDGYALYPQRFSVNITSHIEWYLSRGVDITVILSMRDRTISRKGKLKGHCEIGEVGDQEDAIALELMSEALQKYGIRGSRRGTLSTDVSGKERAISVPYEALMSMKQSYLFGLYRQLGINSTYVPSFSDGNKKYITDANEANLEGKAMELHQQQEKIKFDSHPAKPISYHPPPPNEFFLPRRLITVFSLDSSRMLSTALGVAIGAFPSEGRWVQKIVSPYVVADAGDGVHKHPRPAPMKQWVFEDTIQRPVRSLDGEIEVQHVSLPWGVSCQDDVASQSSTMNGINVVEALVPSECFRSEAHEIDPADATTAEQCQDEVHITKESDDPHSEWTCGARCGGGAYDGYAMYPKRFFVNITSHIEWYTSRGVDVTVVLQMRDRSITKKGKPRDGCSIQAIIETEDEVGLNLMNEAYDAYGFHGSKTKKGSETRERAIVVSYEGLMELKETYLFDIYQRLGIESTYVPLFMDDNGRYITDPPPEKKVGARKKPGLMTRWHEKRAESH
eukprot:scaffold1958_cov198-Alexandrium_tamarense.AAC.19